METVQAVQSGNHHSRKIVLLARLDVKNAFNSARWIDMIKALEKFEIPVYLLRILKSYLKDRVLTYATSGGTRWKQITAGAAQGSILGPNLWNISYDDILRMKMPEETYLSGYVDDIVAVLSARNIEKAQWKLNQVMRLVNRWMDNHALDLATQKTELLLITGKRIPKRIIMQVGTENIETKLAVKHLGIIVDTKLTFFEHLKKVSDKAATATTALSRLMANINGPRPGKRRLLMSVTESILLYGSEIWADALKKKTYRERLIGVQYRGALRIACSYRTVSVPAALVIAGVIPIDLLALERKSIYLRMRKVGKPSAKTEARKNSMTQTTLSFSAAAGLHLGRHWRRKLDS